jgi:hypothetical protein
LPNDAAPSDVPVDAPDPSVNDEHSVANATTPLKAKPKAEVLAECTAALESHWAGVKDRADVGNTSDLLEDEDLLKAIRYSLNCKEKGYHYVLLTQVM